MLDYLTEPRGCSIYSVLERWLVNLMETRGGRRGGGALAQTISGFHRGGLIGDHRICLTRPTATWKDARARGAWSVSGQRRRGPIWPTTIQVGATNSPSIGSQFIWLQDLYATVIISIPEDTNRSDDANHDANHDAMVTGGEGRCI